MRVAGHFAGFACIRPRLERTTRLDAPGVPAALLAFGLAGFFGNLLGAALAGRSPRYAALTGAATRSVSPVDALVWSAELRRPRPVMRQIVGDGLHGELALHVELRAEGCRGQDIAVDAA